MIEMVVSYIKGNVVAVIDMYDDELWTRRWMSTVAEFPTRNNGNGGSNNGSVPIYN